MKQGLVILCPKGVTVHIYRLEFATTFAEDWESPEMDAYDNYDEEKAKLQTLNL